jgi:inner membrane protein YidH
MIAIDDPRVVFAAERTLLAWQRSALALMGFGFVIERFGLFLTLVSHEPLSYAERGFSLWLGVALLALAAIVALASALQFRRIVRASAESTRLEGYWPGLGVWVNFVLAIVAVALAIHLVAGY